MQATCAICFQPTVRTRTSVTRCGHRFCCRCLDIWRDRSENGNCPNCRRQLPEVPAFAEACADFELAQESLLLHRAARKFREVLLLCVDSPWAAPHFKLGSALSRLGDIAGAEASFRKAAELRRDDPDIALNWGKALLSLGRRTEAQAALQRAQRLQPSRAEEISHALRHAAHTASLIQNPHSVRALIQTSPLLVPQSARSSRYVGADVPARFAREHAPTVLALPAIGNPLRTQAAHGSRPVYSWS
eukprot:TRINITY_DN36750_c0_g1_i1.p1 TRINITY_DN36750_c0_g1~~TRINITY_DN36750_c0_g1_i1.p1  ORF type:complete len:257 (+),score=27.69 TRINITY_DN36750_c0_g1_i1:36-773(+)